MQINLRNQSFKPLMSARRDNKRDLQHLLSPKSKKSSRNVCKVNESVECYYDRKEAAKNAANKKKMSWNKKKNVLMHNGSYFLKNVLVWTKFWTLNCIKILEHVYFLILILPPCLMVCKWQNGLIGIEQIL